MLINKNKRKVVLVIAGHRGGRLPYALLALAANLDDDVLLLDNPDSKILKKHTNEIKNAICVGISTITGTYIKHSLTAAKAIRAINPQVPLVWGGWHPSLKPEQTLESEYVDKVIVGQGEQAFSDLVKKIKNGEKTNDIISYDYMDRNSFPVYGFDLIKDMRNYITPYTSPRTISLYTSQGCPYGCKFCVVDSVYGKKFSSWPIETVLEMIDRCVKKYAIDGVNFIDDNFFIGKKRPLEFADQLLKSNIKINWSANARIDVLCRLKPQEWEMLDRSGCKRLLVGAESGAQATLDRLNKKITVEMIIEFGCLCYKYNIIPCFSMMVGVPDETPEEIDNTFKLIDTLSKKIPTSELLLFLYTPYPGTILYDLSLEKGFVEPQSLEGWSEFYLNIPTTPWVKDELRERVEGYNKDLPLHRDLELKCKDRPRFNLHIFIYKSKTLIYRIQYLISKFFKAENKVEALLQFLQRRISRNK